MKIIKLSVLAMVLIGTYSCKETKKEADAASDAMEENMEGMQEDADEVMDKTVTVQMMPKSGSNAEGTVTFTQEGDEVTMSAEFSGLSEGEHAIHIHENGDCSADDGTSAGGHWNPTGQNHGKLESTEEYHGGDIGNMTADADGNASIEFSTDQWCIGCDDNNKNIVGHGVIVHAEADDFESQPSGAAGSRVSCGAIME